MNNKAPSNEDIDPRWQLLLNRHWSCSTCHQRHNGMFDLAHVRPDFWSDGEDYVPNSAAVSSKHFLSEDFCVLNGEHYFVRCILRLPLLGVPDTSFAFGVWSTLSEKNFGLYKDAFDSGELDGMGPWFGWLSNRMEGIRIPGT